jgi:hypothetical protein
MIAKIFGFIGKWFGYLILILIGIAFLKNCVLAPENPDSLEYRWDWKLQRYWDRSINHQKELSERPPFLLPQESIKCCSMEVTSINPMTFENRGFCPEVPTKEFYLQKYNEFLITEALKGRALLIGGRGEDSRLETINSMSCKDKYDSYFTNYYESFNSERIEKLLDEELETDK